MSDDGTLLSCRDLMCGWRQWLVGLGLQVTKSEPQPQETWREHVRNALQLLAVFDHTYPMEGARFVVYQAEDIAAVTARLRKALGV